MLNCSLAVDSKHTQVYKLKGERVTTMIPGVENGKSIRIIIKHLITARFPQFLAIHNLLY